MTDLVERLLREQKEALEIIERLQAANLKLKEPWTHTEVYDEGYQAGFLDGKAAQQWQPIETAPKDKAILIAGGTYYYDAGNSNDDDPFAGVTIGWWQREAWCAGYGSEYDGEYWHKPTYWMPLPQPPEEE